MVPYLHHLFNSFSILFPYCMLGSASALAFARLATAARGLDKLLGLSKKAEIGRLLAPKGENCAFLEGYSALSGGKASSTSELGALDYVIVRLINVVL